ncbi:MAG: Gfo/Idh/MocA family protein [Anaerolineae bacterium]|nr:Gfo/Idh/MocA family oxidoreductase [Chloroflexota bacterium]
MSRIYRVGVIGFGHMHINNVAQLFHAHPQVQFVACADTVPRTAELRSVPYTRQWNKNNVMAITGMTEYYADFYRMLIQEQLDIVIVTCENAQHPVVVEACAEAGVHVCVEKPMAMTLADGLRMVRACEANDTSMVINWPLTWQPAARKAKALIDEGLIGDVLEVKWRSGHTGPLGPGAAHAGVSEASQPLTGAERAATWWHQREAGGGSLLDFTSYGAMVSRWYIGEPAVAAMAMRANLQSQYGNADDNAAVLVRFPRAMALLEGSWTTFAHGVPTGPIVYGTTGTLVVEGGAGPQVRLERGHGDTTIYPADPLPAGREDVAQELIHHLETGEPVHPTLDMRANLDYMAIIDAAARSADSAQLQLVQNAAWSLG